MAKVQKRNNREAKKPKQTKTKPATTMSPFDAARTPPASTAGRKG